MTYTRREPPPRPARTHTPIDFAPDQEAQWKGYCEQLDELNQRLAPLMEESATLHHCNDTLLASKVLGKPAYQDFMNTRRASLRMLLDTKKYGGEYTVELLGANLNNLKLIPDYIRRITEGLASDEAFLEKHNQILTGLQELQNIGTQMQKVAQKALDDFAESEAGKSHAAAAVLRSFTAPKSELGG